MKLGIIIFNDKVYKFLTVVDDDGLEPVLEIEADEIILIK